MIKQLFALVIMYFIAGFLAGAWIASMGWVYLR